VCGLPAKARAAVEAAYLTAEPYRAVALRAGVSRDAVARHRRHVAASVRAATDAEARARGDGLLDRLDALDAEAREVGEECRRAGDRRTRLLSVRERTRILELRARLAGELRATEVNVLVVGELTADDVAAARAELAALEAAKFIVADEPPALPARTEGAA
jgi:hypothetical protein